MIYLDVDHGRKRYRVSDKAATLIEISIALSTGNPIVVEKSSMGYYDMPPLKLVLSARTQWQLEEKKDRD